ncbi:MAG: Gfo/Idh/MocA family oxidoreductase [Phycisphaerales bacterium]
MSISIGFIGAGAIGRVHAQAARDLGLKLAGIADINQEAAKKLADDLGGVPNFPDTDALLSDQGIGAVVIGVPNAHHASLAIKAMRQGKDVLLEKPMGLNADECRRINAAAEETGKIVQIGYVHRFSSVGRSAKRIIGSGALGKVYHVKAQLSRRRGIPGLGGWFTTKAQSGGGPLIDVGVHVIDLAMYLLGGTQPTRVSGKTYAHFGHPISDYIFESMWAGPPKLDGVFDVEDEAHALLHFADGTTLALDVAWAVNTPADSLPENLMAFFGDKGGLSFQLFGDHMKLATEIHKHNADSKLYLPEVRMYHDQLMDFANAVGNRTRPCADGSQGLIVQSVIDAIYESSETGREITLTAPSGAARSGGHVTPAAAGYKG